MRLVYTNKQKGDEIQMTFKDLTEILEAIIKLTPVFALPLRQKPLPRQQFVKLVNVRHPRPRSMCPTSTHSSSTCQLPDITLAIKGFTCFK